MYRVLIFFCLVSFASCATPVAPTGGQPIRTAPQIISTSPEQGTTQFDKREIWFEFDRFMNRGSATRALRIEPDIGISYSIGWKRKVLVITFTEPLPDSVTIIVSLGTELSDIENNRLGQPFQLAFSTGSTVDSAGVDIATISFDKANEEAGVTVGLFRESALDQAAVYMAESDTAGIVRFRNTTPGQYVAVLLDDRNRNRRIDVGERHFPAIERITIATDTMNTSKLVYSTQDTVPPSVLGVGLLSNTRLRVRFSEPIRLSRSSTIDLIQAARTIPSFWLFTDPSDPTVAYANSIEPMVPGFTYTVKIGGVSDYASNMLPEIITPFTGSNQPDTTQLRIVRMPDEPTILSRDSILVVYSKPIFDSTITDSLIVIDGERTIRSWPDVYVEQNRLFIYRKGGWRSGQLYQLRVWDPMQLRHSIVTLRTLNDADLGSLEVVLDPAWDDQRVVLEVVDNLGMITMLKVDKDSFILQNIVPGVVTIRAWVDMNNNGRWDGGRALPNMIKPEPVLVQKGIPISPRLTTVIRLGSFD